MLQFLQYQANYLRDFYNFKITPETEVFAKPDERMEKHYAYRHFNDLWSSEVMTPLCGQLEMNRYSEKGYTIYSLRSTFIEDCITDGLDVYLVAKLCGNSVSIIQKHYDRHNVLNRASEVQAIEYGKEKRPEIETINLENL